MIERDKHILCIKNIFHDTQSITMPSVAGFVHTIYIVKTANKKYICRFSNKTTAQHNQAISKLLLAHNINVPDVSIRYFEDMCCETYPFLNGKTLHERMLEGISDQEKARIYEQLFDWSCKIASVKYNSGEIMGNSNKLSKIVTKIFGLINHNEPKVLSHIDLNTKNIILDSKDNICALIDLDSVDERNFSTMFTSMISCAKSSGYTPEAIIKKYIDTTPKSIISIRNQIKIYHCLRQLYINIVCKHMLNSRNK